MASSLTGADKDRYEEDLRIENYIFNVYRVTGDKPKAAKVRADGINVDGTPRTRTDATAAPVRQGIAGRVGFAREPAISPEDNPSAATRHKRALALATTRRHFDLPPRYRYRTLLGRGGQGIALKMTYTPPNNPDAAKNFVLKTGGTLRYNTELRHEARMMEVIQILHSSGPAFHEEVDPNDSSDDALSSDDEGASRRPQPPPDPEEKKKAHSRRWKNWEAKLRLRERRYERILKARSAGQNPPPEDPNNPDAQLDIDRFDFIFMEYMPLGSLMDTLYRMADQRANDPNGPPIPDKVLWSFWLCMLRACVAMAFPPRKFHPDRNKGRDDKRPNMARAIDVAANYDPDELLLEEIPGIRQRGRVKRMVHMDIDAGNMFLGEATEFRYNKNSTTYVDPPTNANPAIPAPLDVAMEDHMPVEPAAAEHADIPVIKEQFSPDWDFMPLTRDGKEVSKEPVAGNYDVHSNIWQMALTMWQLITLLEPPTPPRLTDLTFGSRSIDNTYGILLDHDDFKKTDVTLRRVIANCLKHVPDERPKLEELLPQAKRAAGIRARSVQDCRNPCFIPRLFTFISSPLAPLVSSTAMLKSGMLNANLPSLSETTFSLTVWTTLTPVKGSLKP
ncbi:hypothetical protein PG991_008048 [Apiospora marii]|uniref:Protein kinase domain-containing protein n=1 Tax=Apiospora marii TaxID=335849 RepID=A0ABR1RX87_9PEZI